MTEVHVSLLPKGSRPFIFNYTANLIQFRPICKFLRHCSSYCNFVYFIEILTSHFKIGRHMGHVKCMFLLVIFSSAFINKITKFWPIIHRQLSLSQPIYMAAVSQNQSISAHLFSSAIGYKNRPLLRLLAEKSAIWQQCNVDRSGCLCVCAG